MEPAAPGTEDELKLPAQSPISKKETETERLLAVKARLPNGKLGNVFELTFNNGSEHWYCNLCQCPIMGRVYHHEIGKRHTNNVQAPSSQPSFDEPLQLAPGEPIPPGVESEIQKVAEIQERLDNFTVGPLIGLEYLFELIEYDRDKEPSYLCLLCDKRGDPRTVIAHLASYNHIIQYIRRHFISCFRAISPYITKQYKRNWQFTMQKIAEAIENKFGRLKPHVVDHESFEAKRMHYQNLVASGLHFSERSGFTFEELVDIEQLTKIITDEVPIPKVSEVGNRTYRKTGTEISSEFTSKKNKRSPSPPFVAKPKKPKPSKVLTEKRQSLSSISSISSSDLSDCEQSHPTAYKKKETHYRKAPKTQSIKPARKSNRNNRSRSLSPARFTKHEGIHPWQRSDYIRSRSDVVHDNNKQKTDKLDEFKKLAAAIENDMDRILKQHCKNPEKHPQYNEEWKKYWNKRYKELQAEGKNVVDYDFKPGWIEFWNKRLLELHHTEVKGKKDALRKRLGLPDEPAPICFKITGKKKPTKEQTDVKVDVPSTNNDQDSDVIVIEDKDDDTISSKRSHSPWESETGLQSRKSRGRSREKKRSSTTEYSRASRDRSKDYKRSRSKSRDRDWHRSKRSRDRERYYDNSHYRDSYRKSELPDYIKPPRVMRDVTRHPVMSPPMSRHVEPVSDIDDDEVNIVGVLRLLTALEEKLGSLGPKVIDLLAQALALEKGEANSSEALLDNEMNCVLFETVKEKLKGQLLAGLVDYNQEKAFKNAIKKIASLIHYAGERKKNIERERPNVDPIKVPGIGTVDKAAIAKQIATALVLQGKTDVSQSELEQLINAVIGMAEASRNSQKPVTTASFLQQFSQSKISPITTTTDSIFNLVQPVTEPTTTTNSMEGLSDLDLQTLLQNFKDLCTDEQHSLISYLKKLEAKEPERVERLRKFVNLDSSEKSVEKELIEMNPRSSPFANRLFGMNPIIDENVEIETKSTDNTEPPISKVTIDSDDEDYSFEDVFKAAKKNVKEKEERDRASNLSMFKTEDFDLSNAKSLIANIMGQFKANNSESGNKTDNFLGLGKTAASAPVESNTNQSIENIFRLQDFSKPTPNVQARLEVPLFTPKRENLSPFSSEPTSFPRNYLQNVSYPEPNQYMNQNINQNHPRSHFDQGRAPYRMENVDNNSRSFPMCSNYDNYGRW